MVDNNIVSQLENLVNLNKQPYIPDAVVAPTYINAKLKFTRNQKAYHWSYKLGNKKYGVSSVPLLKLTSVQKEFLRKNGSNDSRFIIDDDAIIELHLKIDGEYVAIDSDIIDYSADEQIRKEHGFVGFTFLPNQDSKPVELPVETTSDPSFDELKELISQEKSKFKSEAPITPKKPSIPLEQKKSNLIAFVKDFDNQIHKIFKDIPNKEINIANDGFVTFTMLIEEGSQDSINHQRIVNERNHRSSKLDTIDGETMFSYLMNPIYEYLGFDRREDLDRKHYTGMGDSGDFKYGTTRLDIKTRKKESNRLCNLLVNEGQDGFNVYGLVLREGDQDCKGAQRRLTFTGVASQAVVRSKPPQEINKALKYEVGIHQLTSLRDFVLDVLLEVIQKEEN